MAVKPQFNEFGLLLPGVHELDEQVLTELLGFTSSRKELIEKGLKPFLRELSPFKPKCIYIDGSFVTGKPIPGDIDGFIPASFGDPLHMFLTNEWKRLKAAYRIDFYPALTDWVGMGSMSYWMDFFGATRDDPPQAKGIISLGLTERS